MAGISILQMLAVLFLGVFAQLYMRIFVLNGSLDKIWLMFFCVPPLSLVPALMMYFGAVSPGQGGKPYDMYMWLPAILSIVGPFFSNILDNYDFNDIFQVIVESVLPLLGGIFAFFLRDYTNCNARLGHPPVPTSPQQTPQQPPQTTNNLLYKSFSNAIITFSIASIVETVVYFIPIVGQIFKILSYIPILGTLLSGLFYAIVYIIVNMYNNTDARLYCLESGYGGARGGLTTFCTVIFILILIKDIIADKLGLGFLL
jgi:hypothetical protein